MKFAGGLLLGAVLGFGILHLSLFDYYSQNAEFRKTTAQLRDACNTRPRFRREAWGIT